MVYLHNGLKELYILQDSEITSAIRKKAIPISFANDTPPGTSGNKLDDYRWHRYLEFMREFIYAGVTGYDDAKSLANVDQSTVNSTYGGSWDKAILHGLADIVSANNRKLYAVKWPVIHWTRFKEVSKAKGMRDKVKSIDKILKRSHLNVDTRDVFNKADVNETGGIKLQDLTDLIAACEGYLGDKKRKSSTRRPAIQELLDAAELLHFIFQCSVGSYSQGKSILNKYPVFKSARTSSGFTAIGKAAIFGNLDNFKAMIGDNFPKNELQSRDWLPIDLARARAKDKLETHLDSTGGYSSAGPTVSDRNSVNALVEATVGEVKYHVRDIEAAFTTLYNNDLFKPILDLAAKDARKGRDSNYWGLRFYYSNSFNSGETRGGMGAAGNYDTKNNTLGFCGKGTESDGESIEGYLLKENATDRTMWQKSMEGTLIHELTHFAAYSAFDNWALPYTALGTIPMTSSFSTNNANEADAKSYYQAYVSDYKLKSNENMLKNCNPKWDCNADEIFKLNGLRPDDSNNEELYLYALLFGHVKTYNGKTGGAKGRSTPYEYDHGDAAMDDWAHDKKFTVSIGQEIIAHISQAIHLFGKDKVKAIVPSSYNWYKDVMMPKIATAAR